MTGGGRTGRLSRLSVYAELRKLLIVMEEDMGLDRLTRVERAEDLLRELGFSGFRVRYHEIEGQFPVAIARIEVPAEQLPRLVEPDVRERVVRHLEGLGFTYVTMDLAGFRSGSGNVALTTSAANGT